MKPFAGWENFYVIVGSSAGALIGLQFVVLTLIADGPRSAGDGEASNAFATPTIMHFCAVLLLAGIASAPWSEIGTAAILWGALGLGGVAYAIGVTRRLRSQAIYKLQLEDRLFHILLPFVAYATLGISAWLTRRYPEDALFVVAAAALLLLFIGIHNAWDGVTYHVFFRRREERAWRRRS